MNAVDDSDDDDYVYDDDDDDNYDDDDNDDDEYCPCIFILRGFRFPERSRSAKDKLEKK